MVALDKPAPHRPSSKFWDKIAEKYARKPVANEAVYQQKLRITRDYFRPDSEVLEFGCGTGSTALAHAPFVKHILATDLSPKMLEIARGKAGGVDNVTFRQATLDDLDAPAESFDVVLGLSILHLLEDRDAAIARVHQLLKPGGVFVSSTACLGDKMKYFKLIAPIGRLFGFFPLVKVFSREELKTSLQKAGFVIDQEWDPDNGPSIFIVAKKPS